MTSWPGSAVPGPTLPEPLRCRLSRISTGARAGQQRWRYRLILGSGTRSLPVVRVSDVSRHDVRTHPRRRPPCSTRGPQKQAEVQVKTLAFTPGALVVTGNEYGFSEGSRLVIQLDATDKFPLPGRMECQMIYL